MVGLHSPVLHLPDSHPHPFHRHRRQPLRPSIAIRPSAAATPSNTSRHAPARSVCIDRAERRQRVAMRVRVIARLQGRKHEVRSCRSSRTLTCAFPSAVPIPLVQRHDLSHNSPPSPAVLHNLRCILSTLVESIAAAASRGLLIAIRPDSSDTGLLHLEIWNVPPPGSRLPRVSIRRGFPAADFAASEGAAVIEAIELALAEFK